MVQLQDVHVANGGGPIKGVTGAPVKQMRLRASGGEPLGERHRIGVSEFEHGADIFFAGPIKDRGRKRDTGCQILGHADHLVVAQVFERLAVTALVVERLHELAQLRGLALGLEHVANALSNAFGRPPQMHFKHLTHVHARGDSQGVQDDVTRCAVGHVRHVFDGDDLGDHPFVAVTARHFVARLQASLDGQVDLDHFEHTGL